MTTVVTDWSYIAWAWSAESPASTMSAREDLGADDRDADGEDGQADRGRGEGREGDPGRDPATRSARRSTRAAR